MRDCLCSLYEKFRDTALWKKIDRILAALEENHDIKLTTAREYVVGYLCEQLSVPDTE